tara:strand:- start:1379 stop:2140 length:762 start_codon:yes stop_codon:yes gene_type:complete
MLKSRLIPVLLLDRNCLVKTVKFSNPNYIGDPINTVLIFNELEVDELIFLDIKASLNNDDPNFKILRKIADECFMPLAYGGGISSLDIAKNIFDIGFEKIVINSHAMTNPKLIEELAHQFGSQAIIVAIDVRSNIFGKQTVRTLSGRINSNEQPLDWAKKVESLGAGEIILTSIDREGSWGGYDLELIKKISDAISIPVIANGGCGSLSHIKKVINESHASAAGLSSMVLYQKKDMGVLINTPDKKEIEEILK